MKRNTSMSYRFNICDSKDKTENFLVFQKLEKISSKIISMKLIEIIEIKRTSKEIELDTDIVKFDINGNNRELELTSISVDES